MIAYKLPCSCGNQLTVVAAQAGEWIHCACGSTLEVPTIRKLAGLETVSDDQPTPAIWGGRQRLIFLGLLTVAVALGAGIALQLGRQRPIDVMQMAPAETLQLWGILSQGALPQRFVAIEQHNARIEYWIAVAAGVGLFGVILTAVGFALRPRARPAIVESPSTAAMRPSQPKKKRRR